VETPSNLLLKFSRNLFCDPPLETQFVEALLHPQPFHPCILWCQPKPAELEWSIAPPLPWQPSLVDRLEIGAKPGRSPLHQQGYFYCLDFSSVFAISTLLSIAQPIELALDMCASPGGKGIFAWVALQPQQLISNEVIGKRMGALVSNLKRCLAQGETGDRQDRQAIALSFDSKILAAELPGVADLVIVDAPCTGQSLLAKGEKNPGCFHPVTINKNANRQKRILANSAQLVAPQGYLAYMTCAYSVEENEAVSQWFLERFPQFQPLVVPHLADYQSHVTQMPCYRMFPQDGLGAGAFTILFQNKEMGEKPALLEDFLERSRFTPIL
jgi:16S rRNA C967 or C1407 C5-methylase (RsmB/RsmF family)